MEEVVMRRMFLMLGLTVGIAATADAQTTGVPIAPLPFTMPGTTVGQARPIVQPVGTRLPQAAPQAGTPISGLATQKPNGLAPGAGGSERPQGTPIDMKNVIAPYPGMPKETTYWQRLEERWFLLFESNMPAVRPNYTPGIARRNKERKDERMVRKWWE